MPLGVRLKTCKSRGDTNIQPIAGAEGKKYQIRKMKVVDFQAILISAMLTTLSWWG